MKELGECKDDIIEALSNIVRFADYQNIAGRIDIHLFYGWELGKNANKVETNYAWQKKNPSFRGT